MSDRRTATSAGWTRRPERGSQSLARLMARLSLALGRGTSRVLLRAVAAYFYVASPAARRHVAAFLRRVLGREPRVRDAFANFLTFATTIHDRVFFLAGRTALFDVRVHGPEQMGSGGAILLGAHVGSFEALRSAGHHHGHRRVTMAMYEQAARRLNVVLGELNPGAVGDIVALGRVGSMLALADRLEAGDLVGVLADRTLGAERVVHVPFLGEPAAFPIGPMRVAAVLRQRVFLMMGLYRGGNRYDVFLEPLADFSAVDRQARDAMIDEAIRRYAARLEHYVRLAPDNWFNFHDFWGAS
jgi:predicted LPLAT superfamily acyltransferase